MTLIFQTQVREESDAEVIATLLRKGWQEQPQAPVPDEGKVCVWNAETQLWEQQPLPPMSGIWHPYNFLLRFTGEERQALIEASRTDAILEDFRGLCAAAPAIELESPRTVAGMNYLVALNILTPERRDAILDPNL